MRRFGGGRLGELDHNAGDLLWRIHQAHPVGAEVEVVEGVRNLAKPEASERLVAAALEAGQLERHHQIDAACIEQRVSALTASPSESVAARDRVVDHVVA